MNTSVSTQGAQIIAAMTPSTSRAAFNRAHLIVEGADAMIVEARTYTVDGRAEGPGELTREDVRDLIDAGQAIEISPMLPLISGAALWVLRPGLPRRDQAMHDLRASGVLLASPVTGSDDARLCVVKEDDVRAIAIRDRWRDAALVAAKSCLERGEWQRAVDQTEIAQAIGPGLRPDVLALLSFAYERCGRHPRAQGLVAMARNSRGEEFAAQVLGEIQRLNDMHAGPSTPAPSQTRLWAALGRYSQAARQLGHRCSARLPGLDDAAVA